MDDPTERILARTRERRRMLDEELGVASSAGSSPLAPIQTSSGAQKRSTADLKAAAPATSRSDGPSSPPQKRPSFTDQDRSAANSKSTQNSSNSLENKAPTAEFDSDESPVKNTNEERTHTPRRRSLYPVKQLNELSQSAEDEDEEESEQSRVEQSTTEISMASESQSTTATDADHAHPSSSATRGALLSHQRFTHISTSSNGSSSGTPSSASEARRARFKQLANDLNEMEDDIPTPTYNLSKEHFMPKKTPPSNRKSWGTPKSVVEQNQPTPPPPSTVDSAKSIRFASPLAAMAMADESMSTNLDETRSNTPNRMMQSDSRSQHSAHHSGSATSDTDLAPMTTEDEDHPNADETTTDENECGIDAFYRRKRSSFKQKTPEKPSRKTPPPQNGKPGSTADSDLNRGWKAQRPNHNNNNKNSDIEVKLRKPTVASDSGADSESSSTVMTSDSAHRKSTKISQMANFWESKLLSGGSTGPGATSGGSGSESTANSRPVSSASGTSDKEDWLMPLPSARCCTQSASASKVALRKELSKMDRKIMPRTKTPQRMERKNSMLSFVGDSQRLSAAETAKTGVAFGAQQSHSADSQVSKAKHFWEAGLQQTNRDQPSSAAPPHTPASVQKTVQKLPFHTPQQSETPSSTAGAAAKRTDQPVPPPLASVIPPPPPIGPATPGAYYRNTVHSSLASTHAVAKTGNRTPAQCELVTKSAGSVSGLRNRWELSSATGALLTPDTGTDDLAMAAVRLAQSLQPRRHFECAKSPKSPSAASATARRNASRSNPPTPNSRRTPEPVNRSSVDDHDEAATSVHVYDKTPSRPLSASIDHRSAPCSPQVDDVYRQPMPKSAPTTPTAGKISSHRSKSSDFTDEDLHDQPVLEEFIDDVFEEVNAQASLSGDIGWDQILSPRRVSGVTPATRVPMDSTVGIEQADQVSDLQSDMMNSDYSAQSALVHSVSFYRSKMRQRVSTVAKSPIQVVTPMDEAHMSTSSPGGDRRNNDNNYEKRIRELNAAVNVQQQQISQASQALNFCRTTLEFRGSREEVDAQRALLLATERRRVLLTEIDRVASKRRQTSARSSGNSPTGTLTISHISVPLKREFVNNNYNLNGEMLYYFICLVKHADKVHPTQLVTSDEGLHNGQLEFQHFMQLTGLQPDFHVRLEVYSLRTIRERIPHDAKYRIHGATLAKGRGKSSTLFSPGSHSPAGPTSVLDPSFQLVGHLDLSLPAVNRQKFRLDGCQFTNPIEGSVFLKLRCYAESAGDVHQVGFLNLFEEVTNIASWTRYWCVLREGVLRLWRYPDDENIKEPLAVVDVSQCVNRQVMNVSREECARPHTFRIDLLPDCPKNGPIVRDMVKIVFSADNREDFQRWTTCMNEALHNLHMWNPEVARQAAQVQQQPKPSSNSSQV